MQATAYVQQVQVKTEKAIFTVKHYDGRLSQFDVLQLALEDVDRVAGHDGRRQIIP